MRPLLQVGEFHPAGLKNRPLSSWRIFLLAGLPNFPVLWWIIFHSVGVFVKFFTLCLADFLLIKGFQSSCHSAWRIFHSEGVAKFATLPLAELLANILIDWLFRYYAICLPLQAGLIWTKGKAALVCIISWILSGIETNQPSPEPFSPVLGYTKKGICNLMGSMVSKMNQPIWVNTE